MFRQIRRNILPAIAQIFRQTEQKCRKGVAQLPDGFYEASLDEDDGTSATRRCERVKSAIKGQT